MKVDLIFLLLTGIIYHCVYMKYIADNQERGRRFWIFNRCNGACTLELNWHCGWNPNVGYQSFSNRCAMDFHNKCTNAKHKYKFVGYGECGDLFPVAKNKASRRYNLLRSSEVMDADHTYTRATIV